MAKAKVINTTILELSEDEAIRLRGILEDPVSYMETPLSAQARRCILRALEDPTDSDYIV